MKTDLYLAISYIAATIILGSASEDLNHQPISSTKNDDRSQLGKILRESANLYPDETPKGLPGHDATSEDGGVKPEVKLNRPMRGRRAAEEREPAAAPPNGKWSIPRVNIIGGEISLPNRWKWSVALTSDQYGFVCGATIIDPIWLLTAAHCVYSATAPIKALIGAWNLTANDYKDSVLVDEIIVHPGFEGRQTNMYDIALLKLVRPANVTNSPEEVLTLPNLLFNLFELNPNCYIIGWGVTEPDSSILSTVLRQKRVNVISSVECQRRWDEAIMPVEIAHTNLCIDEGPDGDVSACFGDSGSPLQCYDLSDGVWKLAGLSSWGSSSCSTYPSVYAKVQAFLDWIYQTILTPNNLFDRRPRTSDPEDGSYGISEGSGSNIRNA